MRDARREPLLGAAARRAGNAGAGGSDAARQVAVERARGGAHEARLARRGVDLDARRRRHLLGRPAVDLDADRRARRQDLDCDVVAAVDDKRAKRAALGGERSDDDGVERRGTDGTPAPTVYAVEPMARPRRLRRR